MSPPTPLEMQLDSLAEAYGMQAESIMDLAVRNLAVMASYQMGKEGAAAEQVFKLLLAPDLASEKPRLPKGEKDKAILAAAASMTKPFTSRDLAASCGFSSVAVGGVLGSAGWPSEAQGGTGARVWQPKVSG